jgi:uncharacterized membrane protein
MRNVLILLVVVGAAASVGRALFPNDFGSRMDPSRQATLRALGIADPRAAERPASLRRFDAHFATNRTATFIHVIGGGLFIVLAPLQFSSRIRKRHIRLHRWTGRVLLVNVIASGAAGLFFGLIKPFAGPWESIVITLAGGWLLFTASRAYLAIRRKEVARHREWMIRAFATAIGISTVRVISLPADLIMTPMGFGPEAVLLFAMWTGWPLTISVAELWILRTRAGAIASAAIPAAAA